MEIDNNLGILPTLDKNYILSKITQEQIFEYYFDVKVEINCIMKSPRAIRGGDDNPSFSFYYSMNGKLRAQDFAGYFHGDCFDAVAYVLHISSKDKKGFSVILDRVARDFRLHKYEGKISINSGSTFDSREAFKPKEKTIIEFQPRSWNKIDEEFWRPGCINRKMLEFGRVYACDYVWVNNQLRYTFAPKDPAYAYYFSPNEVKIYFPYRENYRFLSNTSYLQGIDLLLPDEIGLITKSYKDVLSTKAFEIQSVAPSAESVLITQDQWFKMKTTCTHWFSLMDYDRTGILMARKLRNLFGIQPLFFSNTKPLNRNLKEGVKGKFSAIKLASRYNNYPSVKDFFNFVSFNGKDETFKLINKTKELYNQRFEEYDTEMYNNLQWIKDKHYADSRIKK